MDMTAAERELADAIARVDHIIAQRESGIEWMDIEGLVVDAGDEDNAENREAALASLEATRDSWQARVTAEAETRQRNAQARVSLRTSRDAPSPPGIRAPASGGGGTAVATVPTAAPASAFGAPATEPWWNQRAQPTGQAPVTPQTRAGAGSLSAVPGAMMPVLSAMTAEDLKPTLLEYALRATEGNLLNTNVMRSGFGANAPAAQDRIGLDVPITEINIKSLQNRSIDLSSTFTNANMQLRPTPFEGDDPIHFSDLVPMIGTSATGIQWNEVTAQGTASRKDPGGAANDGTPTTAPRTAQITRLPLVVDLDERLVMNPDTGVVALAQQELNSTLSRFTSVEMITGDGSSPNQLGIQNREATQNVTFSRGTDPGEGGKAPYGTFIKAVAQGAGMRAARGFIGGTVAVHPQFLYELMNYRESGEYVFRDNMWPLMKYGLVWRPAYGLEAQGTTGNLVAVLISFTNNARHWIQGMTLRVLDQTKAVEGRIQLLLNIYDMYQWVNGGDIVEITEAN